MRDRGRRLLPLVGAILLLVPARARAQNPVTINGRVQSEDGAPLAYAELSIPSLGVGAVTRDDGRYAIFIPGARVTGQSVQMTARRLGYKAQTVTLQLTEGLITKDFSLAANPLQLGELVVTGARAGQGVVLITTKSGRAGATRFSYRSSASFDNVSHFIPLQTSYGQGLYNVHADTALGGECDDPGNGVCRRSWGPLIAAGAPV